MAPGCEESSFQRQPKHIPVAKSELTLRMGMPAEGGEGGCNWRNANAAASLRCSEFLVKIATVHPNTRFPLLELWAEQEAGPAATGRGREGDPGLRENPGGGPGRGALAGPLGH